MAADVAAVVDEDIDVTAVWLAPPIDGKFRLTINRSTIVSYDRNRPVAALLTYTMV